MLVSGVPLYVGGDQLRMINVRELTARASCPIGRRNLWEVDHTSADLHRGRSLDGVDIYLAAATLPYPVGARRSVAAPCPVRHEAAQLLSYLYTSTNTLNLIM